MLLLCVLAGCQTTPPTKTPSDVPTAAVLPDAPVYTVDPTRSEIHVHVYSDGPLSGFGHNHVVTAPVAGVIHAGEDAAGSGFRLHVDVDAFKVDPPSVRREAGKAFATKISAEARRGTRENMLGAHVLDAANHPTIRIDSLGMTGPRWNPDVTARLTLRGVTRKLEFPAAVFAQGDTLVVIANFEITQSAFGIEPFSVMGGGLTVRDALDVRVRIIARKAR